MADVMDAIDQRRQKMGLSQEIFATRVGVTSTTYSRQKRGQQALGLDALQAYVNFAHEQNDIDLLEKIGTYILKLNPGQLNITSK